jgi:hypothetical protein
MAGTTTNNGWDYPTSTDLLKDGALAIQTLATDIDTSVGTGLLAWTAFTPTFTNFTLGNGTVNFARCQIGKTVHVRYQITLGTTSIMGTAPTFALPITPIANMGQAFYGSVYLDTGVNYTVGTLWLTNVANFAVLRTDFAFPTLLVVNSTTPFTWGNGDFISGTFTYQAA